MIWCRGCSNGEYFDFETSECKKCSDLHCDACSSKLEGGKTKVTCTSCEDSEYRIAAD